MAEVAVLIPYYNAPNDLLKTIQSINESIHVDIFIIDDGSKKKPNISGLNFYKNGKLFLHGYKKNKGIEYALNYGLKIIEQKEYPFIARLDCADTCEKNRFQKQLNYLNDNKEIAMLGSWVNFVDDKLKFKYDLKLPTDHEDIKNKSYLNAMFIHPTIFFRSSILKTIGYYPTKYEAAEDYAFFFKVIKFFKTANYPDFLVNVEINDSGISASKRKVQVKSRIRVILDNFHFGFYPIYGLFRNIILLYLPRNFTNSLKKIIYNR